MRCLFCGHLESKVIDSRSTEEGTTIRRRRECLECGKRFTTYEKIETIPMIVVKKDGLRETWNREKVLNGILRACEKRPVTLADIEKLIDDIESKLYNMLEREVTSEKIGEMVMERLQALDDIAYVRFASVYRQFKDINSFMDELAKIIKKA
ncbi:MAG: transcriptional repressor NrdR [Clostridia bacterium]|nr:transcriptional repressor NrdR [Oscillospiraceae bacterium]MBQ7959952.1 transcriptional repressor NrdR [Clostridia bacterium]